MNGPSDLPNVFRFRDVWVFGIIDTKTDLWAFAGLPENVKQAVECENGTDDSYAVADIQLAGVRDEVIKAIIRNTDVTLNVYRFSTFEGICVSDPIATGRGTMKYHDNDLFWVPGDRRNTFGWWMGGPVTLTTGGSVNLMAHNLWYITPDGTLQRQFRQVILSGQ